MPKNNSPYYIPSEIKKPVEIVCELKEENQIPNFEEFMKSYQADENLNYDDLEHSDVGNQGGYGPTTTQKTQTAECFFLKIECNNWHGGGSEDLHAASTSMALSWANTLENGFYPTVSHEVELKCANLIRRAVQHYRDGNRVSGYVRVKGKFWGGYEWSYSY